MPHRIKLLGDAQRWHDRANETRAAAEALNDPEAKRIMLEIADSYDRLADRARRQIESLPPSPEP